MSRKRTETLVKDQLPCSPVRSFSCSICKSRATEEALEWLTGSLSSSSSSSSLQKHGVVDPPPSPYNMHLHGQDRPGTNYLSKQYHLPVLAKVTQASLATPTPSWVDRVPLDSSPSFLENGDYPHPWSHSCELGFSMCNREV